MPQKGANKDSKNKKQKIGNTTKMDPNIIKNFQEYYRYEPNDFIRDTKESNSENKGSTDKKGSKRKVLAEDFYKLYYKQKGLCANKDCKKHHKDRQKVSTTKDIDHIYPITLWELTGKKGNVNDISNLQLLCTHCHKLKNAEDRKKIALYKDEQGLKTTKEEKSNPMDPN